MHECPRELFIVLNHYIIYTQHLTLHYMHGLLYYFLLPSQFIDQLLWQWCSQIGDVDQAYNVRKVLEHTCNF
jgi:uncharacterized protein (UPF0276 family)